MEKTYTKEQLAKAIEMAREHYAWQKDTVLGPEIEVEFEYETVDSIIQEIDKV